MGQDLKEIDLIFLHGFLGLPSDWKKTQECLNDHGKNHEVKFHFLVPDYFKISQLGPLNSFEKSSGEFLSYIEQNTFSKNKILIGYSLGGRLALHIFEKNPDLFLQLILISTNPGLTTEREKLERELLDKNWSEQFKHHPWSEVLKKWNQQAVFKDSQQEPDRKEENYQREQLSQSLVNWSLAKQQNKKHLSHQFVNRMTWINGEKDRKFNEMMRSLKEENPQLKNVQVSKAGHRVLFDNPEILAQEIFKVLF